MLAVLERLHDLTGIASGCIAQEAASVQPLVPTLEGASGERGELPTRRYATAQVVVGDVDDLEVRQGRHGRWNAPREMIP